MAATFLNFGKDHALEAQRSEKELNSTQKSSFFLILCIFKLDILSCGETNAISLGLSVKKLQLVILISGALAVSAAVCAGGTIGFVGLIAPHIARKIFGTKAKTVVPLSMVTGASVLLLSDTICRTVISPAELPVGTVTAILGAPFFISLLFSKKRGIEWMN